MPKIEGKFTKAKIDKLSLPKKPEDPKKGGQIDYFEHLRHGRSLILSLSYAGTRSWNILFYEKGGKPKRKNLGYYPNLEPEQARNAAFAFDVDAELGRAKTGTFREVSDNWLRRYVDGNGLLSATEIKRHLTCYVLPSWGERPLLDIRRNDVNLLLDRIVDKHGAAQADAVLATIRACMSWQESRDQDYQSPIVRRMKRNQNPVRSNRWLSDDEIRAVWIACDELGSFGRLVKILLLTGQRLGRTVTMQWSELVDNEWRIPRQRREKGNPGTITLPPLALGVLNAQPRIAGCDHVFAGLRGNRHVDPSLGKTKLDKLLQKDMPKWVLHDLRRTTRKLLTRAKVPVDVAELLLGHSLKGIRKTYDDVSEYRQDIDDALLRVASEVNRVVNPPPPNVVLLCKAG